MDIKNIIIQGSYNPFFPNSDDIDIAITHNRDDVMSSLFIPRMTIAQLDNWFAQIVSASMQESVTRILERGIKVAGTTVLHQAVFSSNTEIFKQLLHACCPVQSCLDNVKVDGQSVWDLVEASENSEFKTAVDDAIKVNRGCV